MTYLYKCSESNLIILSYCSKADEASSEKVAIKSGYKKEGTVRKAIKLGDKFTDAHVYAKVK